MPLEPVPAAVLVLCFRVNDEEHVVLTRRTEEVLHHKGQICFPGGAKDSGDQDLWQTALRESEEEIGLDPKKVTFVRELRPWTTPTGFLVTPFVGLVEKPDFLKINQIEIAELFTVPLSHFRDSKSLQWVRRDRGGMQYLDPLFVYRNHEIWGLTGRILCDFLGHPFPNGSVAEI